MSTNRLEYEMKAKIIKALAHPSRLMMVDALAEGEKCVCELTELVGADISTVSKHLSVMKNAGIVDDRKAGQQVFYRLRVPCIIKFFGCVEAVMREDIRTKEQCIAGVR
jgi:DNA-binding transcriptional ArsR family regulator